MHIEKNPYYLLQRSCGKVMFTPVCDSVHGGGVSGRHLPSGQTPPRQTPPCAGTPQRRPLQRTVRILLECILVVFNFMGYLEKFGQI